MWRKRLVRLHMREQAPSVEGVLTRQWAGHYVIAAPKVLESAEVTHELEGELFVPRERVLYVQVTG